MCASIFIAATGGRHKFVQQSRLLLDLSRTGDKVRRIVISHTIVGDGKDVQLHTTAISLNNLPAFKDPDKINAVRLQSLHSIHVQRHTAKVSFSAILLDDFTYNGVFIGRTKSTVDLAVQHSRTCQARTRQCDQSGSVVLDDGRNRHDWL